MPERPRRPDLDELFSLPMEPDEALRRILEGEGTDEVSGEPEDEETE
jgi:hypothetical protein